VLIIDNASLYRTEQIEQLCYKVGVKLVYLPPYSPDLNSIKEFFAELKAFIKKSWQVFKDCLEQGFDVFLEWCIDVVSGKKSSA
jgi:transposase